MILRHNTELLALAVVLSDFDRQNHDNIDNRRELGGRAANIISVMRSSLSIVAEQKYPKRPHGYWGLQRNWVSSTGGGF